MEKDENTVDPKLKLAFNDGYLFGLYKTDLANSLQKQYSRDGEASLTEIDMLFEGIAEGAMVKEQQQQIVQDLKNLHRKAKDIDREK